MTFGERLKAERLKKGWSQEETAQNLGTVTRGAYSFYELNTREPTLESLNKLADIFGVSVDYLLGREPAAATGAPDLLLRQLLAHLTRIDQNVSEMKEDIRELKEIAQAGAQLAERITDAETDIKLLKKIVIKE